eukprot:2194078-Karenia_brevis.AAC.1
MSESTQCECQSCGGLVPSGTKHCNICRCLLCTACFRQWAHPIGGACCSEHSQAEVDQWVAR